MNNRIPNSGELTRDVMIQNLYCYMDRYTLDNPFYKTSVIAFMNGMLGEDLSESGCITALAIFNRNDRGRAIVRAKQPGILAGLEETCLLLDTNHAHLQYCPAGKNGRPIQDGDRLDGNEDPIIYLEGDIITILEIERTLLNILQRMSGIATEVNERQRQIIECGSHSRMAATRKLQWGRMDKKAFIVGGGLSHRRGLYDTMMIKDTAIDCWHYLEKDHPNPDLQARRIEWIMRSIDRCWKDRYRSKGLIVEVQTVDEAKKVAHRLKNLQAGEYYPCSIMLDNFKPPDINRVLEISHNDGTYDWTLYEASGNINQSTIIDYARTGVDVISTGSPTHSPNGLDIHMKIDI